MIFVPRKPYVPLKPPPAPPRPVEPIPAYYTDGTVSLPDHAKRCERIAEAMLEDPNVSVLNLLMHLHYTGHRITCVKIAKEAAMNINSTDKKEFYKWFKEFCK